MVDACPPIVIDRLRLIYIPVAKAACSSVKMVLRTVLGMPPPQPLWTIHDTVWPRVASDINEFKKLVWEEGYKAFTVVRNPWDRLYGTWGAKFHPDRFKDLESHHDVFDLGMTFEDFVDALYSIDLTTANEHIAPQSYILKPYFTCLPHIMRFETLRAEWAYFRRRAKLPELPHLGGRTHACYVESYDERLLRQIGTLYSCDVTDFKYTFTGW